MSRPAARPGLEISGPVESFTQVVPACLPEEVDGRFDVIVLAVKAQATEAAMQALLPHLSPGGYVLSAQNGLNELTIARLAGAERTMGCFVNFVPTGSDPAASCSGNRAAVVVGESTGSSATARAPCMPGCRCSSRRRC